MRRDCLKEYAKKVGVELILHEEYGLDEFCQNVASDISNRCVNYCYPKRLGETVRYAAENGYDHFTTTLLVSPYQKHEELKKVCEKLAQDSGVEFLYRDFRVGFRDGQTEEDETVVFDKKLVAAVHAIDVWDDEEA